MWSDDGIVLRLPEAVDELPARRAAHRPRRDRRARRRASCPTPRMFASRFRECAARALLLPRRRPDRRTPLWQQRQRAADLLAVAAQLPDVPDPARGHPRVPQRRVRPARAARGARATCASRKVRVVAGRHAAGVAVRPVAAVRLDRRLHVRGRRPAGRAPGRRARPRPRPAARAARRRGAARAARPGVLADLELELQRLVDGRRARDADELHDLLRRLGPAHRRRARRPVPTDGATAVAAWVDELVARAPGHRGRASAGEERVGRGRGRRPPARRARRARCPLGLPAAFTDPVDAPARRPGRPLRPHPRPVPHRARSAAALGVAGRPGARRRSSALEADGPGRAGRVPARRRRARVVRRRRAAPAAAPVARRAAPRGRAGRRRRRWPASSRVAGRRRAPPRPRRAGRGARRAAGRAAPGVGARGRRAARPARRLPAGRPRRAVHRRRGGVGRRRRARRRPTAGSACVFRDQVGLLVPGADGRRARPTAPVHDALRAHLAAAGRVVLARPGRARRPTPRPPYDDATVLAALWDLVWAARSPTTRSPRCGPVVGRRPGQPSARRGGPAAARPGRLDPARPARGRRPLVAGRAAARSPAPHRRPRRAHARALQLLERHGVLTREAALAEGVEGGFAGVYPVLKALEERGQVRRGYFVAGLGAAQFALPGAVDRLRAVPGDAATSGDRHRSCWPPPIPAQPYGAALRWPETTGRPGRARRRLRGAGRRRARRLRERGARAWSRSPAAEPTTGPRPCWPWSRTAGSEDRDRQDRRRPGQRVPRGRDHLRAAGFTDGYKGLTFRS